MTEPQTPATPQAGGTGDTSAQAATTTSSTPQAGGGKTPEDYERMLAEVRKEAAAHRTKLKAFEDAEAQRQLAAMGDLEKAQKLATELQAKQAETEKKLKDRIVRSEVALQASSLGIAHPEKVFRLIDTDELKFDDVTGEPTNAKALVEKLLVEMPELIPQGQQARAAPATGANNPGRANTNPPGTLPPNSRVTFGDLYSQYKKP